MNQHITKLVRQALKECVSTPVESVAASRIDDHGIVEIPNTFAEKFAQLIVWEAIGVCRVDVDALTAPFLSEYEKGVVEGYRRANENLRDYFGVEE